jgi:hypothetical protein
MSKEEARKAVERLTARVSAKHRARLEFRQKINTMVDKWCKTLPNTSNVSLNNSGRLTSDLVMLYTGAIGHDGKIVQRAKDLFVYVFGLAVHFGLSDEAEQVYSRTQMSQSDKLRFASWSKVPINILEIVALGRMKRARLTVLISVRKYVKDYHDIDADEYWEWIRQTENIEQYVKRSQLIRCFEQTYIAKPDNL